MAIARLPVPHPVNQVAEAGSYSPM